MLLLGKEVQEYKKQKLIEEIDQIDETISFVIIQVGDNPASNKYINNKLKFAKEIGMNGRVQNFPLSISEEDLITEIIKLNNDDSVHGVIIQLPLPNHLNSDKLATILDPNKDLDGFHPTNIGNLYLDKETLVACTSQGIIDLLEYYNIPIASQNVVIAGRSNLVGKNLALLLINRGATVTVCNSKTKNIQDYIDTADIFISAIGSPHFYTKDNFKNKKDLTIIDVGINFLDNKLVGDVDYKNIEQDVKAITPVPGGVGVLTVTAFVNNVLLAYKKQKRNN